MLLYIFDNRFDQGVIIHQALIYGQIFFIAVTADMNSDCWIFTIFEILIIIELNFSVNILKDIASIDIIREFSVLTIDVDLTGSKAIQISCVIVD